MTAVLGRTEINLKETDYGGVVVPDNPVAKLMYYFDCVCICAEPDQSPDIRRLRKFKNYSSLSDEEEMALLALCLALSPDKLLGTIFFPADDCDGAANKFMELSAVDTRLIVSDSLVIGGQRRKVRKIMFFERDWIEQSYIEPLRAFETRSRRPVARTTAPRSVTRAPYSPPTTSSVTTTPSTSQQHTQNSSSWCIIL